MKWYSGIQEAVEQNHLLSLHKSSVITEDSVNELYPTCSVSQITNSAMTLPTACSKTGFFGSYRHHSLDLFTITAVLGTIRQSFQTSANVYKGGNASETVM